MHHPSYIAIWIKSKSTECYHMLSNGETVFKHNIIVSVLIFNAA